MSQNPQELNSLDKRFTLFKNSENLKKIHKYEHRYSEAQPMKRSRLQVLDQNSSQGSAKPYNNHKEENSPV